MRSVLGPVTHTDILFVFVSRAEENPYQAAKLLSSAYESARSTWKAAESGGARSLFKIFESDDGL